MPVAIYLPATGAVWQGVVLIAYGVLVIGLVDNLVRPILVSKEIPMPDYVVLHAGRHRDLRAQRLCDRSGNGGDVMAAWGIFYT